MNIPIILIHRGDEEYLKYSLMQATVSNPDAKVILIGKEGNKKYCSGNMVHALIDDYMTSSREFAKIYKHVNHPIAYEYILFCFQRWFVLRDYMNQHRLLRCCYLDSDVMLYTNLNNPLFNQFTFEFTWTNILSLDAAERFCWLTTNYFSDMDSFQRLVKYTRDTTLYGVNDMVMSELFLQHFPSGKKNHGLFEDCFFDENIHCPIMVGREEEAYETFDAKKKVYLIEGQLYCKKLYGGRLMRANSLHFWGPCKQYMKYFSAPQLFYRKEPYYFHYPTCQWTPA